MITKILLLSLVPWIILVIQNSITLHNSQVLLDDRKLVKENILFSIEVGRLMHMTQIERGLLSLYVSINSGHLLEERLNDAYRMTDMAVAALSKWKTMQEPSQFKSKETYHSNLRKLRNETAMLGHDDVIDFFSNDNAIFVDWIVQAVIKEKQSNIWPELVAFQILIRGKEYTAIERTFGTIYFSTGHVELHEYKGMYDMGLAYLSLYEKYSAVGGGYNDMYILKHTQESINTFRNEILNNNTREFSVNMATWWFDNMTTYIDQLGDVNEAMAKHITQVTDDEITEYKLSVVMNCVVLTATLIIVPFVTFFIYKTAKTMDNIKKSLEEKTSDLEKEQARTETLLSQMVPSKVAKKMATDPIPPENLPKVYVMYAEICEFESIVSKAGPEDIFTVMNTVSDVVNKALAQYNVTRLEPCGNAFVFASGIQRTGHQDPGCKIADMAIHLVEYVRQVRIHFLYDECVKVRIGISSGPVVAGVVDVLHPRYRLYGATVDEARALAASSQPLSIQISESVKEDISTTQRFMIQRRDDDYKTNIGKPSYWLSGDCNHYVTTEDLEVLHV